MMRVGFVGWRGMVGSVLIQRMLGQTPHLTRQMQERMAAHR